MRGLACVLMFQTHCYDSWLSAGPRKSMFFMYSQLGGTLPAPLFLFLAGISFALVTGKLLRSGAAPGRIAKTTIRRGAEIFGLGLLFRLQEYAVAWGWSPWTDLFRVDILNTIGLSMMLMGLMCWAVLASSAPGEHQGRLAYASAGVGLGISLATPLVWTIWRPRWLPWPLQSYLDGVHNLGEPQSWLFPVFPWTAFAFTGLAVGFLLQAEWARRRQAAVLLSGSLAGLFLMAGARWLDAQPRRLYPVYDFWRTSPSFFLMRVGLLLILLSASYAWCRWGAALLGFSPLLQLGQTSLLVYWVHIEFVYGRLSILPKRAASIRAATIGLVAIFLMMLALSWARTQSKARKIEPWPWLRRAFSRQQIA